jgi:GT2 family glycosyltransferase
MDSSTGGGPRTDRRRGGEDDAFAALRSGPFGGSADDSDPWSWAAQEPVPPAQRDVSSAHVTAVLVAFDAARWLNATLDGLEALTRRPERLIAVDNGSDDATSTLLERARDRGLLHAVYRGERGRGFGDAVRSALEQDRTATLQDSGTRLLRPAGGHESRWLWLLHDDAIPAPDALQQLLAHALAERLDITGPKLLLPRRRQAGQQISEVGVSISGTGRRELGVDVGEIDQGQRDEPAERLGVSTCGMLLRTAVWNDLDGLDPALPVFRDGVELGWRAHLNGYRVVTTPQAEMTHRQVGR